MVRSLRQCSIALLILTFFMSGSASAATILLSGNLSGAAANAGAGTGSSGTGSVNLSFDDVTKELEWSGAFSGLTQAFSVAHFHGPAAPNANGGVTIGTAVVTDPGGLSGTSNGTATLSATQEADLLGGLWYWNVHSSFAPGGELRANISIVPEPGTAMLLGLGLGGLALQRRRN